MDAPGSFSGMIIFAMPERGSDAFTRKSFEIMLSETASCFKAPGDLRMAS